MTRLRPIASWIGASTLVVMCACGKRPAPAPPPTPPPAVRQPRVTVVLLPDDDSGKAGRAIVSNAEGSTELAEAWASTRVSSGGAPSAATAVIEGDARHRFDGLRASLPAATEHFVIYFRFESDRPAGDGLAVLTQIARAVSGRPDPEVVVMGHTDTAGAAGRNLQLGRRRAEAVKALLVKASIDPARIEISTYGETAPQVVTPDDVAERRNRRVEIIVR